MGVCDDQGWVTHDFTADEQFTHVDDFAGLGTGTFGRLAALQGNQSLWCGARPGGPTVCTYAGLPGYGNAWLQWFCTLDCLDVTGDVTVDFLMMYDVEPAEDFVTITSDQCDDNWITRDSYDGVGQGLFSVTIPASAHSGQLKVQFQFASDGATLVQEDPCVSNLSCAWAFIKGSTADYACAGFVAQQTTNSNFFDVGVVLSGFSYHSIRDDRAVPVYDRLRHLTRILTWLNKNGSIGVGAGPGPLRNSLGQNYPNPFNPVTTISFTLERRSHVRLRVYNVSGQLVAALLDEPRDAGITHRVSWNGRNGAGVSVSSGVYFYKLESEGFSQTRKMVLLK